MAKERDWGLLVRIYHVTDELGLALDSVYEPPQPAAVQRLHEALIEFRREMHPELTEAYHASRMEDARAAEVEASLIFRE